MSRPDTIAFMTTLTGKFFSSDVFYRLGYVGLDFFRRITRGFLVYFLDNPVETALPLIKRYDFYFNPFMILDLHTLEGLKNAVFKYGINYLRHIYSLLTFDVFIVANQEVGVNEQLCIKCTLNRYNI